MNEFNLNYITLITAIVNITLGFVVLRSNKGAQLNRLFFIFTLILALWSTTNFLFQSLSPTLIIFKSTYATGSLALVGALPWIIFFTRKSLTSPQKTIILTLGFVLFSIPYMGGLVIKQIVPSGTGYTFESGPLFTPYGAILVVLLAYLLISLILAFRKSSGIDRIQYGYTLFGISFFALVSFLFGVILPLFNIKSVVAFDAQSSLIWVGFTAFAITRHRLFNIKVLATQAFIVLLLILVLFRAISAKSTLDILFESAVFIFTAIISFFLVRSVQGEVSRREEIEKLSEEKTHTLTELEARNKNLATLQKISQLVLNEFELRPMAQRILDEIPKQLDNCIGALLSLTQQSNLTAFSFSANSFSRKIYSLVGSDLEKYSYPLQVGFNKMHDALLANKMLESEKLQDFISPPIPKSIAATIQTLLGMRHIIALPLYAGGQPLGVMLFVYRQTKNDLGTKDVEMAQAIADDMSLAIQRAEAYQKLKDANEYLSQLDKMKDEFISMASHELNTPLAAIEGYLSMILDEGMGKVDAKSKVFLTRAYDSSKRLAELILDLLNVSRIEQGRLKMKFSQCQLVDLAESVIHELQIKADSKKIYLKLDADKKKVPPLWCDPDRIREVYVNLVGNALKFTEKGGVTVKITKVGDHIHSEVIDTGRGIAKIDQKKLFQKFSQVKREVDEHQGTGLGLYISKNFLELHHGKLSVESDEGKGATFMFDLPMLEAPPKQVEGAILEQSISAPRVEVGPKEVPGIIARSSDRLNS